MSIMTRPSPEKKKMVKSKKKKAEKKACGLAPPTGNPPGNSPTPPEPLPNFTPENQDEFEKMQKHCYEKLHKPRVTKITNWGDKLYYICKECMDKYMKEHEELEPIIVSFGR